MAGKLLEQELEFLSVDVTSYCMDEVLRAFDDLPLGQPQQVPLSQKQQVPKRCKQIRVTGKQLMKLKQIQQQQGPASLKQLKSIQKRTKENRKPKPKKIKRKRNPCSLCHVEREGVRRRIMPCGHVYHKTCFWTQLSINCPLCPKSEDDEEYNMKQDK